MHARLLLTAILSAAALAGTGCAVPADQDNVGAYLDDATLTTRVKASFADDKTVSTMAISVQTLKGTVQLSGFARSLEEKQAAGRLALQTSGVVAVQNDIVVRS